LSCIEALTLAPMRCSQFLESPKRDRGLGKRFEDTMTGARNLYARILPFLLDHKWITLGLGIIIFASSTLLFMQIPKEFSPKVDEGRLFIMLKTKEGSSMEFTSEKVDQLEKLIIDKNYIERY